MKHILFVVLINTLSFGFLNGQSETFEIIPDFYKTNNGFTTNEIQHESSEKELEFIGLSCYHFDSSDIEIYYRLKIEEQWSAWVSFEKQHEFVEASRSAYQAKPLQISFSSIQFKTVQKLSTPLTVRFFIAAKDKKDSSQGVEKSLNCDMPDVCDRTCWCPICPIDNTPEFTEPTHLIVHHSAGNNQSNNFGTIVEFIWDLHTKTNGWDDIGYNWLIDPNGVLYEGRGDNLQGAHFSCLNENTVGICVIGDYTVVEPSEAALSTLVNVLAYEATEHDIDIEAQSYHVTGEFDLDNVAGHRDSSGSENACSTTACPGNSFYPMLTDIRVQVAELACYNNELSSTESNNVDGINVFPNPIQDDLFVESENQELHSFEIVDVIGRSIGTVYSGKSNDLSHLPKGTYFLLAKGEVVRKLIKDR